MAIAEGGLARDLGRWLMNTIIAAICQKSMDCRLLPVPEPSPNGAALALLWAKSPTQAPRVEDQLGNFPSSGAPQRGTRDFRLAEKTLRMMAQSRANQRRPPREAKVRPAAAIRPACARLSRHSPGRAANPRWMRRQTQGGRVPLSSEGGTRLRGTREVPRRRSDYPGAAAKSSVDCVVGCRRSGGTQVCGAS